MAQSQNAVYRIGPHPEASDYSKTLLQALAENDDMRLGSVSRVQLLITCLVERLHDAIYVLPRHARNGETTSLPAPDPEEYAKDIATSLKALKKYAMELPDDQKETEQNVEESNQKLVQLRRENREMLKEAKSVQKQINDRLLQ
jgi:hypothetical protein